MSQPLVIAKNLKDNSDLAILSNFANRHGLITGATGTGKTVTLQKMAESFSNIGVPVFLADIKGDLTGLGVPGKSSEKLMARLNKIGVTDWEPKKSPIELWDLYGERGIPVRATVTDLGPLLLSRILNLNEVQTGILQIIFRVASDNNLLMIDFKDLRTLVRRVGENPKEFTTDYGNINKASIGAIQRSLLMLEEQGAEHFFAEPSLAISDLMARDADGRGKISILESQKLINSPKLYSVFLLWLLSSLFDKLPEVGDIDKPKLVFFFDEAHLLFNDIPTALLEKIEQVVRLIRSKGVGIYFVTQNPSDVPDTILGQLGNRVQHALRAFSVKDQKAVRAAAQTMRQNPELDTEKEITELAVGEALVSFLDEKGSPSIVQKASIIAPCSLMGEMDAMEQAGIINNSLLYTKYSETQDRESAHELITSGRALVNQAELDKAKAAAEEDSLLGSMKGYIFGKTGPRGGKKNGVVQQIGNGFVRQLINRFIRTVMNQVFGKRR